VAARLARIAAAAGVERHLLAHVAARLGAAQVTHEVDDPGEVVGLEREDPLVVAERERRDGVGADVGVLAGEHAVADEHVAALGVGQQVPVVGPHERVDAHVVARLLPRHERGHVALVELRRPVHRDD
jgi:hypothetical protein